MRKNTPALWQHLLRTFAGKIYPDGNGFLDSRKSRSFAEDEEMMGFFVPDTMDQDSFVAAIRDFYEKRGFELGLNFSGSGWIRKPSGTTLFVTVTRSNTHLVISVQPKEKEVLSER